MNFVPCTVALLLAATLVAGGSTSENQARAAAGCDPNANGGLSQVQLDECWDARHKEAAAEFDALGSRVAAGLRAAGIDPAPLNGIGVAWKRARAKTCTFEYDLFSEGSIAPMLFSECLTRMTNARMTRLRSLLATARAHRSLPKELPPSPAAEAELERVSAAFAKQVATSPSNGAALAGAQAAWRAYRDEACAYEGGTCATDLAHERVAELEAGYIGERFW